MRQVLAPYGFTLNARTEGGNARGALQLAHRRSDTLEKRRRLMAICAGYGLIDLCAPSPEAASYRSEAALAASAEPFPRRCKP